MGSLNPVFCTSWFYGTHAKHLFVNSGLMDDKLRFLNLLRNSDWPTDGLGEAGRRLFETYRRELAKKRYISGGIP
jgi:hypothetical protein